MTKPTREEVEKKSRDLNNFFRTAHRLELLQAYLSQEEELERDAVNRRNRDRLVQRLAELKAENQALKEELKEIQRFVIHERDGDNIS